MRIRIAHETIYSYAVPAHAVIQTLRLTPRNYEGQHVATWRIDVDQDCRLDAHEDAFGNITHTFSCTGPVQTLTVRVDGLVETSDTAGVVRGAIERFPPGLYLRGTDLTAADADIRAYAEARHQPSDALSTLHALLDDLARDITFDKDPTHSATTAAEAFALKRGVCQDFAHIFIAAARHVGIPARYVGGYFSTTTARSTRRPATPGRKRMSKASAGSASIPPTASARPSSTSASPAASTISTPRPSAAPATAARASSSP